MKRVFDHIRDRLLKGVEEERMPPLEELRKTEHHAEVWRLCDNRMLLGSFRYELLEQKEKDHKEKGHVGYDLPPEAHKRIEMYEEDGNTEHLLDAINMLAIEFRFPGHPDAHFSPTDDGHHAEKVR